MDKDNTIEKLATAVYDTGRRGAPLLGCDCIQCFGYCIVDHDMRSRELASAPKEG